MWIKILSGELGVESSHFSKLTLSSMTIAFELSINLTLRVAIDTKYQISRILNTVYRFQPFYTPKLIRCRRVATETQCPQNQVFVITKTNLILIGTLTHDTR